MARSKILHVVPGPENSWIVEREFADKSTSIHDTQSEAIEAARVIAKKEKGEVLIHGIDMKIRQRDHYGDGPVTMPEKKPVRPERLLPQTDHFRETRAAKSSQLELPILAKPSKKGKAAEVRKPSKGSVPSKPKKPSTPAKKKTVRRRKPRLMVKKIIKRSSRKRAAVKRKKK